MQLYIEVGDRVHTPDGSGTVIAISRGSSDHPPYYVALDDYEGEAEYFEADELELM